MWIGNLFFLNTSIIICLSTYKYIRRYTSFKNFRKKLTKLDHLFNINSMVKEINLSNCSQIFLSAALKIRLIYFYNYGNDFFKKMEWGRKIYLFFAVSVYYEIFYLWCLYKNQDNDINSLNTLNQLLYWNIVIWSIYVFLQNVSRLRITEKRYENKFCK